MGPQNNRLDRWAGLSDRQQTGSATALMGLQPAHERAVAGAVQGVCRDAGARFMIRSSRWPCSEGAARVAGSLTYPPHRVNPAE